MNGGVSTLPAGRPKVLIVDDQPLNLHLLYNILQPHYEVFAATSGAQAVALAASAAPAAVLMDVLMPGMDGLAACAAIKGSARCAAIPVLLVSSQHGNAELRAGRAAGAAGFIAKPIEPADVLARLRRHLSAP